MLLVSIRTSEFAVIRVNLHKKNILPNSQLSHPLRSGQFSQTATKATKVFQLEEGFLRALGFNFHFRPKGVFPDLF